MIIQLSKIALLIMLNLVRNAYRSTSLLSLYLIGLVSYKAILLRSFICEESKDKKALMFMDLSELKEPADWLRICMYSSTIC